MKQYRDTHKKERNSYSKKRRKTDPLFRLTEQARGAINNMKARINGRKSGKTFKLIGKSVEELRDYLESLLAERSSTLLLRDLEVDHIFPITAYKNDPEAVSKAMHWSNLQPLTKEENSDKRARLPTKAMASRVNETVWPIGVLFSDLPEQYSGWQSPLHK